jgi:hypothetical protein
MLRSPGPPQKYQGKHTPIHLSDCIVRTTLPNESMRKKDRPKQGVSILNEGTEGSVLRVDGRAEYLLPRTGLASHNARYAEKEYGRRPHSHASARHAGYGTGTDGCDPPVDPYIVFTHHIQIQICGDQRPFIGLNRLCPLQAPARVYSPILARSGDLPAYLPTYYQ